jgi:hypothetical protein
MRKLKKNIPKFKSEGCERAFWAKHDSSEFLDWTKAQRAALPNLRPSHPNGCAKTEPEKLKLA